MKQVNQVGVDVDSEALVCAMQRAGQRLPLARFANTAAGHKQFIRWTSKGGRPVRVCLEATQGVYPLTKSASSEILLYVRLNLLSFDNAR